MHQPARRQPEEELHQPDRVGLGVREVLEAVGDLGEQVGRVRVQRRQQLIELMVDKDVLEVELEEGAVRWRVRRNDPQAVAYAAPAALPLPAAPAAAMAQPSAVAKDAPAEAEAEPEGEVYKSPMLGTFYRAPSPDAEPFTKVGDRVTADSTLCIVEAMKLFNQIKAPSNCKVVKFLVEHGDAVTKGQPLVAIDEG